MKSLVVGAGSIGRRHAGNLVRAGVVVTLVDSDRARAAAVAGELGVATADSLDAALGASPDIAVVCTPSHLHVEVARRCAAAGAHLFIEKPLGASLDGFAELREELRRRERFAMVGCNLRFDDVYRTVQRALDDGALGRVFAAQLHFGYDLAVWRPGVDYRNVYSAWRAQGGGIVLDAIHEIDLALSWFGRPRRLLTTTMRTGALDGDVEDVAQWTIEFASGVVCAVHLNYRDPVYRRFASIAGDGAVLDADFAARTARRRTREGGGDEERFADDRNAMYVRELEHFVAVVRGQARPIADLDDGARALDVALRGRDGGPVVELPTPPFPSRVTAVLQARMGSSRLPGKVLMRAVGKTMLELQIERVRRARTIERIILATSTAPADDAVAAEAARLGVDCVRGSESDVLSRYALAARRYDLPAIVRLTGDCPLSDPDVIDFTVSRFLATRPDYCTNALPRSVPDGLDVEVFSREALERADRQANAQPDREHVTRFFYTHPERFELLAAAPADPALGALRWTLDTQADYDFIRGVFETLYPRRPDFRMSDVLSSCRA